MSRLLFILCLAAAAFAAEENPALPPTSTHRVTGLFAPERETALRAALGQLPDVQLVSVDFDHAEATFRYDPAVAFKGIKPEKIIESFDKNLRAASNQTLGIQPLCGTAREQLIRVEIPVAGLDCQACGLAAYEAIYKIDGVVQATASFKEGRVTAQIEPAKTNRAALEAALEKKRVQLKAP